MDKKMEGSLMAERKVHIRPDLLLVKAIQQQQKYILKEKWFVFVEESWGEEEEK